jgi:hypothetical protein
MVRSRRPARTYLVRHLVAKSRQVSSFAWPVRFISSHSRPQSRIRARDAAGKAGNAASLPCGVGVLVAPEGVVCFDDGVSICGDARPLEPVGFVAPGARAASRRSVPSGFGERTCPCSPRSAGRGGGIGALTFFCTGAAAHSTMQPSNAITVRAAVACRAFMAGTPLRRTRKRLSRFAAHPAPLSCTSIRALSGQLGSSPGNDDGAAKVASRARRDDDCGYL